jgi:L-serine dehydratase
MAISILQLFSIGIGPSSSHTVGPMRAARQFIMNRQAAHELEAIAEIKVDLYGSLALTGKGHCTDIAIILGLQGHTPEGVDPELVQEHIARVRIEGTIALNGQVVVPFDESTHIIFHMDKQLPYHPNGMRFTIFDKDKKEITSEVFYSVGGGFIIDHETAQQDKCLGDAAKPTHVHAFKSANELLQIGRNTGLSIPKIVLEHEKNWRREEDTATSLLHIWDVMKKCIARGCRTEGILPGGLNVRRRACGINRALSNKSKAQQRPSDLLEWVSLWALAVNEENAAGSRVVTAPTNGAAGIIPAVIKYYEEFTDTPTDEGVVNFMLTAGAIGILYKENASISAAEMGCMGEVGVACSMAAAGLTAALGGTNEQIENAAEIGMEHNLGLTCDPIKGLVQIPCIERNTMGAIKAINASLLALQGDGSHCVSLDHVIDTMRRTGLDMKSSYKETSLGGLAVNIPEC